MMRFVTNLKTSSVGQDGSDFSMPINLINKSLTAIFASESLRIVSQIDNLHSPNYTSGFSLMAVLRKEP